MNLEEAYDRYALPLYRHALALTRRGADAEDAVQAAFVKVASRLRAKAAIEDMEAYLHAAVRGEALRIVGRRGRRTPETPLVAPVNGASLEDAEAISAALAELPPEQREVVRSLEALTGDPGDLVDPLTGEPFALRTDGERLFLHGRWEGQGKWKVDWRLAAGD